MQGGNGVADVLFGDVDPSGRLTTTFPRSVGQVPIHYNHFNTGRPALGKYEDGPSTPLYPFGFGLAYTTFEYGQVELSAPVMKPGGTLTAKVSLKNTGSRAGTEVVQLYLRDLAASAGPRPVRELKGFQKVLLQPGESRDVTFHHFRSRTGLLRHERQSGWWSRANSRFGLARIPPPANRRSLNWQAQNKRRNMTLLSAPSRPSGERAGARGFELE